MWRLFLSQSPRLLALHSRFRRYPPWVLRTAVLCAVLTVAIPLMLLVIGGILVGVIVFLLLALVAKIMEMLGMGAPAQRDDAGDVLAQRRNVRIVEEEM